MATHDHTHHPAPHGADAHHAPGADKAPAFAGLIIGGIALFAIMWGTVALTNRQFEGHGAAEGGAKPAAAEAKH